MYVCMMVKVSFEQIRLGFEHDAVIFVPLRKTTKKTGMVCVIASTSKHCTQNMTTTGLRIIGQLWCFWGAEPFNLFIGGTITKDRG